MRATILKRAAMLAIAGAFATTAVTTSFARDRGVAIAAGIAAGKPIGAAAAGTRRAHLLSRRPYPSTGPGRPPPRPPFLPGAGGSGDHPPPPPPTHHTP